MDKCSLGSQQLASTSVGCNPIVLEVWLYSTSVEFNVLEWATVHTRACGTRRLLSHPYKTGR
jgi:hypothetical protein